MIKATIKDIKPKKKLSIYNSDISTYINIIILAIVEKNYIVYKYYLSDGKKFLYEFKHIGYFKEILSKDNLYVT